MYPPMDKEDCNTNLPPLGLNLLVKYFILFDAVVNENIFKISFCSLFREAQLVFASVDFVSYSFTKFGLLVLIVFCVCVWGL